MTRQFQSRPGFDLYEDLMAISRLEAAISLADRRKAPVVPDYTRLARFVPGLKA